MQQDQTDKKLYQFPSDKGKGLVGTIFFHVVVIVVLLLTSFTSKPVLVEEGLLVNFGTDEFGFGLVEPSPGSEQAPSITLPQETAVPKQNQEEKINTQDFDEEAPVVKKVNAEPEKKSPEEIEAEKKRVEEQKRLEQVELDKRKKEADSIRAREASDRVANAINAGRNTGTNTTGEGVTTGTSNQGVVTGSVDSKIRGVGSGVGTDGTSWKLEGRVAQSLPSPKYEIQSEGKVVVEVWVDSQGKVTEARAGVSGTDAVDQNLWKVAKEAALKATFDPKPGATNQRGTITYIFKLK